MPVLIVVLAAYLFFFAIIFLIAIAEYADTRERSRRDAITLPWAMAGFTVSQAFNPVYARFWEAQVPALLLVSAAGRNGLPASRLLGCFRTASRGFPELFDGCGLDQWLLFLEREQLVNWRTQRVVITPQGMQLLNHRFTTGARVNG